MNRRRVGLLAILLAIIAAIMFWFPLTYMAKLVLFFVFCLSIFHAVLAFWTTISKRIARSTDYIYFALTLLTILIAGIAQQREREQRYVAYVSAIAPRPEEAIALSSGISK